MRHRQSGPYQVQAAIAALARSRCPPEDTDWRRSICFYATLEKMQPSPVITLNRSVAVAKVRGPARRWHDRAAGTAARRLFPFFRGEGCVSPSARPYRRGRVAFDRAIALAHTAAEAAHIRCISTAS